LIGLLPLVFVVSAFLVRLVKTRSDREGQAPFVSLVLISIVFLGLISLSFPPGAGSIFNFLMVHVPGFVAEENFYETFAVPFVISMALASSVGLYVLLSVVPVKIGILAGVVSIVSFALYGAPLLAGAPFRNPYYSISTANRVISRLPVGYTELATDIADSALGPVLSLPLLQPDWTYLVATSHSSRSTYIGISPLFYLYGVRNFDGLGSFVDPASPSLGENLQNSVSLGRARQFSTVIEMLGVRTILYEPSAIEQLDFQALDPLASRAAARTFSISVLRDLHAVRLVTDRGFSLYRIPNRHSDPLISIDQTTEFTKTRYALAKVAAGMHIARSRYACPNLIGGSRRDYERRLNFAVVHPLKRDECFAVLRTSYSRTWAATLVQNGVRTPLTPVEMYGFANGFMLPHLERGRATIVFTDHAGEIVTFGRIVSIVSALCLLLLAAVGRRSEKRRHGGSIHETKYQTD
jgi:hypothetical protein